MLATKQMSWTKDTGLEEGECFLLYSLGKHS